MFKTAFLQKNNNLSSIGGTGYSSFFGGNLIKVGGNKLTSLTSLIFVLIS